MFEAKEWTNCLNNKQGCRCTEAKRRNRYSRTFSAWAAIKFEFIVWTRLTEFTWLTYQKWELSVQNEMFIFLFICLMDFILRIRAHTQWPHSHGLFIAIECVRLYADCRLHLFVENYMMAMCIFVHDFPLEIHWKITINI